MTTTIVVETSDPKLGSRGYTWECTRTDTGQSLGRHAQPLYDCARVLTHQGIGEGHSLTTRRHGKQHCDWVPTPVLQAAKWTIHERASRGLQRALWKPRAYKGV
jgi:hypothetical protein